MMDDELRLDIVMHRMRNARTCVREAIFTRIYTTSGKTEIMMISSSLRMRIWRKSSRKLTSLSLV